MEASNVEIARAGLCSEGAVRAAISSGRLNVVDLEDVIAFVMAGRLKALGIGYMDDLFCMKSVVELRCGLDSETESELHYEPDSEHELYG